MISDDRTYYYIHETRNAQGHEGMWFKRYFPNEHSYVPPREPWTPRTN